MSALDRAADRVGSLWSRLARAGIRHARLLGDPESMIGALIMTVWSALVGMEAGTIGLVAALVVGWALHAAAVETGSHVALWLATAGLLIMVVVASASTFDGLPPVLLAAAGTTVLAHNELVRLNYTRRRRAEIDDEVFPTSALAVAAAGLLGVVGVAVAQVLGGSSDRTWLWMPVATGVLMAIAFGLSTLPTRRAPEASRERWNPGARLPPPPSGPAEHPPEPRSGMTR